MKSTISVRRDIPSGTIIIDRPERANAISRFTIIELRQALDDLHQERQVSAVILTGRGNVFSAGTDLVELQQSRADADGDLQWHQDAEQFRDLFLALLRFPKPVIAALNGPACGSGAGLLLAADIVVAASSACLSFPEVSLGLVTGVTAPLARARLGAALATRLMLTAETFTADQLVHHGIASEVVADDLVWARSHELAAQLAENRAEAMLMTKRLMNESLGEGLVTEMTVGAALMAAARTTESADEAVGQWLEARS